MGEVEGLDLSKYEGIITSDESNGFCEYGGYSVLGMVQELTAEVKRLRKELTIYKDGCIAACGDLQAE